ncbi:MAG: hypothetical protein PVS2B2_04370 [Candidatus Acidiferrum sp.]
MGSGASGTVPQRSVSTRALLVRTALAILCGMTVYEVVENMLFHGPRLPHVKSQIIIVLFSSIISTVPAYFIDRERKALFHEMLQRERAQEALVIKAQELARSNAEFERLAYVTSHDLQEPLRMVVSYTQLLASRYRGKLDGDADEFIGFAVEGAFRMRQLIQDLASYSRAGNRGEMLELTESQSACDTALSNLQGPIEEARAVLRVEPLPVVFANAVQLTQLFQNLIGNAVKFRNERRPDIQIGARLKGDSWVFSVQDNGIGIEPQYFERIFWMFQRLHAREEYSGTGIGLAICQKIVERYGGKIWVESQPGGGATFLFTIPSAGRMEQ